MNIEKKYALISVFDKTDLFYICQTLTKYKIGLISTGSTAQKIIEAGFKCKLVSDLTKFKEILDGRVKTLNPKIHASILHDRKNKYHVNTFKKLNFPIIDFVIVNLYPFKKVIQNTNNVHIALHKSIFCSELHKFKKFKKKKLTENLTILLADGIIVMP